MSRKECEKCHGQISVYAILTCFDRGKTWEDQSMFIINIVFLLTLVTGWATYFAPNLAILTSKGDKNVHLFLGPHSQSWLLQVIRIKNLDLVFYKHTTFFFQLQSFSFNVIQSPVTQKQNSRFQHTKLLIFKVECFKLTGLLSIFKNFVRI